jgi:hypothetical protein
MTDFVNLKIKSVQSFGCAHRDRMCVHIFIRVSVHTYINIYIYIVFLRKKLCVIPHGVCYHLRAVARAHETSCTVPISRIPEPFSICFLHIKCARCAGQGSCGHHCRCGVGSARISVLFLLFHVFVRDGRKKLRRK